MSLSRFVRLPVLVVSAAFLASCSYEQSHNRYQTPASQIQPGQNAVAQLQRSAIDALDRQAYQQAIELLQRALRIEPRDAVSWHYLAQSYWQSGDLKRCVEMVNRSFSYSDSTDNLELANQRLRERCLQI